MTLLSPCEALVRELENSYELFFIILISILIKAALLLYLVGLYRVESMYLHVMTFEFGIRKIVTKM